MINQKIKIIDMGLGNINSISKCIQFLNYEFQVITNPSYLEEDCKIIFPGVGSFNHAMKLLNTDGWIQSLKHQVIEKKKLFLGVCLGMQLMATKGYENNIECDGLNFINAEVKSLRKIGCNLKKLEIIFFFFAKRLYAIKILNRSTFSKFSLKIGDE